MRLVGQAADVAAVAAPVADKPLRLVLVLHVPQIVAKRVLYPQNVADVVAVGCGGGGGFVGDAWRGRRRIRPRRLQYRPRSPVFFLEAPADVIGQIVDVDVRAPVCAGHRSPCLKHLITTVQQ